MPESFFGHHIFLATLLAVMALYNGAAVQAILLFSLWYMRHGNFFLKILLRQYKQGYFPYFSGIYFEYNQWSPLQLSPKKYEISFFSVTEQLK